MLQPSKNLTGRSNLPKCVGRLHGARGQAGRNASRLLGVWRTWNVESENWPQRGQFLPDLRPHSGAMGQKDGEKWTAGANLQSTIPKSDRLLGFDINGDCVMPKKD